MASLLPQLYFDSGAGLTPSDGSLLFFKVVGSETPKDVYSDATASTPLSNPVVSDSKGVFDAIYLVGDYDWELQNKNSVQQNTGSVSELVTGSGQLVNVLARDTLNDAVIDTSLQAGLAINIAERTTGNGGGAMWDVVLSSTVTENTYNFVQCTGVGTLSLVLRTTTAFDVRQFGGDPTGATDQAALIEAMLDLLPDSGGIIDFGDDGNFLFDNTVDMTSNTKAVTFKGLHEPFTVDNVGSGTRLFTTSDIPIFKVLTPTAPNRNGGLTWEKLFLDGPGSVSTNTSSRGIEVVNTIANFSGFFRVKDCTIKNFYYGVYTSGDDYGTGWWTIENCQIQSNYWGNWITCNVIRIVNSAIYQNHQGTQDGILNASGVGGGSYVKAHGGTITGNQFEAQTIGLFVESCFGVSIAGNYYENNSRVGLLVSTCSGTEISGNYIHQVGGTTSYLHIANSQNTVVNANSLPVTAFFARASIALTRDVEPTWVASDDITADFERIESVPASKLPEYASVLYGLKSKVKEVVSFKPDLVAGTTGSVTSNIVTTQPNELSLESSEIIKSAIGGAASFNTGTSLNNDYVTVTTLIKGANVKVSILNSAGTIGSAPLLINGDEWFVFIYQRRIGASGGGTNTFIRIEPVSGVATGTCYISGVTSKRSQLQFIKPDLVFGNYISTFSGITAFSGGGQANAVELSNEVSEISVVGLAADSVKLSTAVAGLKRVVINNGANACNVFPNTSDDLGAGANAAVSLSAGANITYIAYSSGSWVALT